MMILALFHVGMRKAIMETTNFNYLNLLSGNNFFPIMYEKLFLRTLNYITMECDLKKNLTLIFF